MRYIALLRGINVGGNSKVDMKKLRATFESLGFSDVSTYINSGNVIFSAAARSVGIVRKIEKGIEWDFGFPVRTVVRTASSIEKLAASIPADWQNDAKQKTDVLFLWDAFDDARTLDLIETTPRVDTLMYVDGAIVWNLKRKDYGRTGMRKFIGTEVYKHMTARNVNTVRKLAEIVREG